MRLKRSSRIRRSISLREVRELLSAPQVAASNSTDAVEAERNRYVRGLSDDVDAEEALADFRRFPTWMWRNTEVVEFVEWLRTHNDALPPSASKAGFYGLDLYSLHASMKAVLRYLQTVDPAAAERTRARYSCFDHMGQGPQVYGFLAGTNLDLSCEKGGCQPAGRAATPRGRVSAHRRPRGGRRALLRRAECASA